MNYFEKQMRILFGESELFSEAMCSGKMMIGKINKFYEQNCLLQQEFVKDNDQKVGKYLESKGVKLIDFVRFEKGEGLEKKEENFADEVASMVK